jgi:hypothetical protein
MRFTFDTSGFANAYNGSFAMRQDNRMIFVDGTPAPSLAGDLNCDGAVNFADINPFVLYLSNFATWQGTYAGCLPENGDINGDGLYPDFGDINPTIALLGGSD